MESIVLDAQNCQIPWNEVAKPVIQERLSLFAKAKGTRSEFLLASCLPAASALMERELLHLENYINNTGLSCKVRWVQAFRKQQETNIVNTNNGTEAQNKLFKYEYLPRSVDKSVYGIAAILVESIIPDSHGRYLEKNLKFSDEYGRYNSRIPTYLHNRPPQFVKHCLDSRFAAGEFTEADISSVNFQKG